MRKGKRGGVVRGGVVGGERTAGPGRPCNCAFMCQGKGGRLYSDRTAFVMFV